MADLLVDHNDDLTDYIEIYDMEFAGFLGVTKKEREHPQPLFVDLRLFLDLSKAGERDKIRETVDYLKVQELIGNCIHQKHHYLIESITREIVDLLFNNFEKINAIRIKVKKPHALRNTEYTAVNLFRYRSKKTQIRGFSER